LIIENKRVTVVHRQLLDLIVTLSYEKERVLPFILLALRDELEKEQVILLRTIVHLQLDVLALIISLVVLYANVVVLDWVVGRLSTLTSFASLAFFRL
jgi:hypothetical protein